jgi:mono/diheme cytochrome c family protein
MMKYLSTFLVVSWLICPFVSAANEMPAVAQQDKSPGDIGRTYFVTYCSACHGLDGRGNGPVAAALRTPPADLTRIAQRRGGKFPEAEIAAYIDGRANVQAHGSREMPVWGQKFSEKFGGDTTSEEFVRGHLLILIQYLKSIQQ